MANQYFVIMLKIYPLTCQSVVATPIETRARQLMDCACSPTEDEIWWEVSALTDVYRVLPSSASVAVKFSVDYGTTVKLLVAGLYNRARPFVMMAWLLEYWANSVSVIRTLG